MGWSCAAAAGNSLDAISRGMQQENSGKGISSNAWDSGGKRYFYEMPHTEHPDGAITGAYSVFTDAFGVPHLDGTHAHKVGSYRIEPDGRVSRGPAIFKKYQLVNRSYGYALPR
jgi:hypothetical protein